jgi:hypothetical protein
MALLAVDFIGPTASPASAVRPYPAGKDVGVDDGEFLAEPDGAGGQVKSSPQAAVSTNSDL